MLRIAYWVSKIFRGNKKLKISRKTIILKIYVNIIIKIIILKPFKKFSLLIWLLVLIWVNIKWTITLRKITDKIYRFSLNIIKWIIKLRNPIRKDISR